MNKLSGLLLSRTAWKDFLLFAVPAVLSYAPDTGAAVRQIIASLIQNHPWSMLVIFGLGLFCRWYTTLPLDKKWD